MFVESKILKRLLPLVLFEVLFVFGLNNITLFLFSQGEKKMASIRNVFAVIRGSEEPDRFVLLGNHRDAWTYGAVDPNSGTAALLDIARRYALLMRLGWNPRRTIILCSWDAEEFGMVGNILSPVVTIIVMALSKSSIRKTESFGS